MSEETEPKKMSPIDWIRALARPVIVCTLFFTFCALVILAAIGKVVEEFFTSSIFITYSGMVTTVFGMWFIERAALKVPGGK